MFLLTKCFPIRPIIKTLKEIKFKEQAKVKWICRISQNIIETKMI